MSRDDNLRHSDIKVIYQQGDKDICSWAGAATALHNRGFVSQGAFIFATGWSKPEDQSWSPFVQALQKCMPSYHVVSKKNQPITETLATTNNVVMVVLQLLDSIGNTTHSVSVSDDFIFDSNEKYALPYSQKHLNRCVSTMEYQCEAVKFVKAIYVSKPNTSLFLFHRVIASILHILNQVNDETTFNQIMYFFKWNTPLMKQEQQRVNSFVAKHVRRMCFGNFQSCFNSFVCIDLDLSNPMSTLHNDDGHPTVHDLAFNVTKETKGT